MSVVQKEKILLELMKNFIETIDYIEALMIYDHEGFIISKYAKAELITDELNEIESEEIYGAFTALVEPVLKKLTSKYKVGELGLISFETRDNRLIFLEAGPEAIVLIITDYKIDTNPILPYCYLFVEKVAKILEGTFDMKFNTLTIPKLEQGADFAGNLMKKAEKIGDNELKLERLKKEQFFKLIILGDAAVGKTTLVSQFVKKEFSADYRPTLGISITTAKYFIQGFNDSLIRFLIYDLAGQEFFKRFRQRYYSNAQAAFVVYDVTRKETLVKVNDWYTDAKTALGEIPFVLIGNKIDLIEERQVSTEEGKKKAEELRCSFIETSALENINVHDTFKILGIGIFFKERPDSSEPVVIL